MAALGLFVIAGLLAAASGQEPGPNDPSGPLIPLPTIPLSGPGARELQLEQNPELLAEAARSLSRVHIEITRAQQAVNLVEGVNANIDCLPWLSRFPGGTTDWLRQRREFDGSFREAFPTVIEPTNRFIVGGEFNRWLNITATFIAEGAEVPDQGDYICRTCVARGTEFEMCHNATLTIHLLGAPPQLERGPEGITRASPGIVLNVGSDICIDRTDPTTFSFTFSCNILQLSLGNGVRSTLPVPTRTWIVEDPEGDVQIYNATANADPEFNDQFFERGNRILLMPGIIPQSPIQLAVLNANTLGQLEYGLQINENATEASMLPEDQRLAPVVQELVLDEILGTYSCRVENVFGGAMASSTIFLCGVPASLPGCSAPLLTPESNDVVPVGCTVCIPRGSAVTLNCTALGSTVGLMYRWTDEMGVLLSREPLLFVSRPGNYTCTASNQDNPSGDTNSAIVSFAPETRFTGSLSNRFGTRPTSGCERLNPMPSDMPDHCAFVGETLSLSCVDSEGSLPVTEGGDMVGEEVVLDGMNIARNFSCAHREQQTECAQDPATINVIVRDPARIDRNVTLNDLELGAGRSTRVEVITPGATRILRCPISGIEDPVGAWFRVAPQGPYGGKRLDPLDSNDFGISFPMNNSQEITLQITGYNGTVHNGIYVCQTSNSAGSDEGIVILSDIADTGVWSVGDFSNCNINCSEGVRVRSVVCRSRRDGRIIPDSACTDIRPVSEMSCNDLFPDACLTTPIFITGPFGQCSRDCKGGSRKRDVRCVVPMTGEERDFAECFWTNQRVPADTEICPNTCCERDVHEEHCARIGSDLCNDLRYQQLCCWTCMLRVTP